MIERTGKLSIHANLIMQFLQTCKDLHEAQTSLPELTQDQFDRLRDGRAELTGTTAEGIDYVEF